jgi:hypothetical protein
MCPYFREYRCTNSALLWYFSAAAFRVGALLGCLVDASIVGDGVGVFVGWRLTQELSCLMYCGGQVPSKGTIGRRNEYVREYRI